MIGILLKSKILSESTNKKFIHCSLLKTLCMLKTVRLQVVINKTYEYLHEQFSHFISYVCLLQIFHITQVSTGPEVDKSSYVTCTFNSLLINLSVYLLVFYWKVIRWTCGTYPKTTVCFFLCVNNQSSYNLVFSRFFCI